MFVSYIVYTVQPFIQAISSVPGRRDIDFAELAVARQSLQTLAASMACDLPQQRKRLRIVAVEQSSRTESDNPNCYYCNTIILTQCLHIIDNLDGHESREENRKTIHKDCLRPYMQNFAEANAKRYAAGFRLYGKLAGRQINNREYNEIYHKAGR